MKNPPPTEWLLEGPPWVQYRTRLDLLTQQENDPQVVAVRQNMITHAWVQRLLKELAEWPGSAVKRHNEAGHLLHKLAFVADLGLQADDPGMDAIVARILDHQSPEGPFQILVNVPIHFGGTSEDQWTWMLCDAPVILYALSKFGLQGDPRVRAVISHLLRLKRENGWPCAVAPEMGKFRGPGAKEDLCPYATLLMLKALAQSPEWLDSAPARSGAEAILNLWQQRKVRRPYLFAMGTDFTKLKAPLLWYDILHALDVLVRFPWLRTDPRLREMANTLRCKADEQGRFTPESVWMAWKGWDFGQRRKPSEWLTLLAQRAIRRMDFEQETYYGGISQ
jgi:hypothetical protein